MPVVQPQPPRHQVERFAGELRIIIPSEKRWHQIGGATGQSLFFALLIIVEILIGLVMLRESGVISAWRSESTARQSDPSLACFGTMFAVIIIPQGFIFAATIRKLIWHLTGEEVISVTATTLSMTRRPAQRKHAKEYQRSEVQDVRLFYPSKHTSVDEFRTAWNYLTQPIGSDGVIAFDYGAKTYRFGLDLEQAEAKQIIRAIQDFLAHPPQ